MQYKDRDAPVTSMAITIKIAFLIYATIPVYIASIEFYRRAPFRVDAAGAAYGLVAVLVLCTYIDFLRLRSSTSRLRPWFSFFQIVVSIVIITIVNLTAGGTVGIYYVLFLLPILIASVMGNLTMISATWALSLAALGGVIWHKEGHHVDTLVWTLAVNGAAWAGAAMAIHFAVRQFLGSIRTAQTVSQLATEAAKVEEWPAGLTPCLPLLAQIMDAELVQVLASPVGTPHEQVACLDRRRPPPAGGEPAPVPSPADLEGGLREAIDTRRVIYDGPRTIVPNRTASGLDVVIVGTRHRVPSIPGTSVTNAVVAGQLVAGIVDRVSLIGGLREEALTDPLTGLSNRRGLYDQMDQVLGHAARSGEPLTVAMVDIDHFKRFNDHHGHLAGDTALRTLGTLLRTGVRQQDVVARFGGEEFCLLLPSTERNGAASLLGQLQATAATTELEQLGEHLPTFSAGVAEWDRVEDPQALLKRADAGLYAAKRAGRNRVVSDGREAPAPRSPSPAEQQPQHAHDHAEHDGDLDHGPHQAHDGAEHGIGDDNHHEAGAHQE
jgi:diguanylate cyclase (GGDEF)-like protein